MPRDPEATRRRIFDAAAGEFARHGIAGARIDRIARSARANKQLIYAYFGGKQDLFDRVVTELVASSTERFISTPSTYPNSPARPTTSSPRTPTSCG